MPIQNFKSKDEPGGKHKVKIEFVTPCEGWLCVVD